MPRRRFVVPALAALALSLLLPAQAQNYPSKPIKVVVPYPAGGNTDLVTRELMRELGTRLGQPVVIDNRAGANGIIGTEAVAKAPPDGYTLLTAIGAFTINPTLYKTLPYSVQDFEPVSMVGRVNLVLAVGTAIPAKTFGQLVEYGRKGAQVTYDSSGVGSALHLVGARIGQVTKMQAMHVPYKGIAQSLPDIVSGRITFTINTVASLGPYIRDGRLVPLAVLGNARSPQLPEVPTIAEAGFSELESYAWQGMLVPARTPRPVIDRLSSEIATILRDPKMREKLTGMGFDAAGTTPAQFAAFLKEDTEKASAIVRQVGITVE